MSNINERLKQFFAFTGENLSEVERKCGFSPQTFRKSIDRDSNLQVDKIESVLEFYPNLSAEWLLRGMGDMCRNSQSVGDIQNSSVHGVNVNGRDIHFDCPFDKDGFALLRETTSNYQKSVETFQHQISELISLIKR